MKTKKSDKLLYPKTNKEEDLGKKKYLCDFSIGMKIRELRNSHGLSLKETAGISGLNINTLSLIENGKTSPSVSTLQQLAKALNVPITAFFESAPEPLEVVYTPKANRPLSVFGQTKMENLGKNLCSSAVQPFVITLEQGAGSGEQLIVHTGQEFVYCLSGKLRYTILNTNYDMEAGDSLVFQAHLPHKWINPSTSNTQLILVLYPADQQEKPGGRHFTI